MAGSFGSLSGLDETILQSPRSNPDANPASITVALVHHGETVIGERLIIHRNPTKKPPLMSQRRLSNSNVDHQKVIRIVPQFG
jgi:hypothetical protein